MPADTDRAWSLLTGGYKASHTSGRQGFERFWGSIDSVQVGDVSATPPDRAEATLTYHFKDGRVVVERTSYELVDEGGTLKIADSDVLSSSTR
jgi:eukaryotic-like serine/threonine-protein kinase